MPSQSSRPMRTQHLGRSHGVPTRASRMRRGSTRTSGLVVACLVGFIFIALIGFFAIRGGPTPSNPAGGGAALPTPGAPPDIKSLPNAPGAANILKGEGMFVQLMDKHDPSRLAGVIKSAHVEPLEQRRYRVDQPQVWIYMKDGKSLLVEAKSGRLYMPDRTKEPEAGTLEGDTTVRLFPRPAPGHDIDPATDEPVLTARMDTLSFDGTLGEINTPDDFTVTSAQTDFSGRNLRVLYNETAQRIELLEVRENGKIVHRPNAPHTKGGLLASHAAKPAPAAGTVPAQTTAAAPSGVTPTPPPPDRKPIETFYDAVFADNVQVVHDQAVIHADQLQVWARTLDNQIAPDAIGSFGKPAGEKREPEKTSASVASGGNEKASPAEAAAAATGEKPAGTLAATPAGPSSSKKNDADDQIVMTWTGLLTMKPAPARPAELAKDEIALRFEAPTAGQVRFADAANGADGRADTIAYGLTSRQLSLAGHTPESVDIKLNNSGSIKTGSIAIDLGTGVSHVDGPGMLTGKARTEDTDSARTQRVTWADQADFEFLTRNGRVTGVVKEAMLSGSVLATDDKGSLKTSFLHASFVQAVKDAKETKTAGAEQEKRLASRLTRIQAKDGVTADDGSGGTLKSGQLDVSFRDQDRSPTPETLTARGNVVAVRDMSVLQADLLTADFEKPDAPGASLPAAVAGADARPDQKPEATKRTPRDRSKIASIRADGNVLYTDSSDVTARAAQLRADVPKQIADLSGDSVIVSKDNSRISGTQLRLDGLARSMEVFGAGKFEQDQAGHPRPAVATWTKGMTFDDATGVIVASGDAQADSYPDTITHDSMKAERVKLEITPSPRKAGGESTGAPSLATLENRTSDKSGTDAKSRVQRDLLKVTATGANLESNDGKPASIESRRYAAGTADSQQPTLERLLYLEGSRIEMNAVDSILTVPVPGKLLVVDRRANQKDAPQAATPASPLASSNARGNALFEWDGTLVMNRHAGTLDMTQKVRLTHHRLGDQLATFMECQHLLANIVEEKTPNGGDPRELRGQLKSVSADGNVFARSGVKEMTADQVDYDASLETMLAQSRGDNLVTMFDPSSPTPMQAKELFWDLKSDRLEVRKPAPIVTPR